MYPLSTKRQGFTLIELLVSITIIAILSTIVISLINVPRWLGRSRDSVRLEEISVLAGSLERYYSDFNSYILANNYSDIETALSPLSPTYINALPALDPKDVPYIYKSSVNAQDFCVCGVMEQAEVNVPENCQVSLPSEYNYCLENTF